MLQKWKYKSQNLKGKKKQSWKNCRDWQKRTELVYRGKYDKFSLSETTHFHRNNSQAVQYSNQRSSIDLKKKTFEKDPTHPLVNFSFSHFTLFPFHMLVQIPSLLLVVFIVLLGALHMLCGSGMSLEGLCSHFPDMIGCTTLLNSS